MNPWIKEIQRSTKHESRWVKRADEVVHRYADKRESEKSNVTKFNILWSNTETLRPSLISATPSPEIRPRYRKKDPIARFGAKILERALEFSLDQYDFVKFGKRVVHDYLLPGRGVGRVVYKPVFEKKKERIPLKAMDKGGETIFVRRGGESDEQFSNVQQDMEGFFAEQEQDALIFEDVYC